MNYTAYLISYWWMVRQSRIYTSPFISEKSKDHIRFRFHYKGDPTPFLTMHTMRQEPIIKEFCRLDGRYLCTATGYPVILLDDKSWRRYTGTGWTIEPIKTDYPVIWYRPFLKPLDVAIYWVNGVKNV